MMGRKTPPRLEPPATMPRARPLLWRNHVVIHAIAGVKMQQIPRGLQIPCERMI